MAARAATSRPIVSANDKNPLGAKIQGDHLEASLQTNQHRRVGRISPAVAGLQIDACHNPDCRNFGFIVNTLETDENSSFACSMVSMLIVMVSAAIRHFGSRA
ncbi:MAG: hypothetical protein ACYC9J_02275 [Sulfuricaulis sp.]